LPDSLEEELVSYCLMMEGKFLGLTTKSRLKAFELAILNGLARSFSYNKGQQAGRGCVTLCAAILD
jgi:hypothetical protein